MRASEEGRIVAFGRNLQPVSALQRRLVEAQQVLERDYARLRHVESRYRLLFRVSTEPVLIVDAASARIVEANPATARIEVRLDVTDASCAECVLPTPLLEQVITDAIARRMPSEFELVLRDPRVAGGISG